MNTKRKLAIVCPLVMIFLIVAFYVLPSAQVGPIGIKIVMANGGFGDSQISTLILKIWEDPSNWRNVTYTDNLQVRYAEVGEDLEIIYGVVYIDKDYASSVTEAVSNTRIYLTIKNPADATVFSAYASMGPNELVIEFENYYSVPYVTYASPMIDLTEGTWTLTTKYEVYA